MKKKVLMLGAAGNVGIGFRKEYFNNYEKYYELILGVHNKKFKDNDFKVRYFSLEDIGSLKKAMKGIDVVINLAANPDPHANFNDLVNPNLIGTYNVFEAAVKSKCGRVIFASSVHAVKGYGLDYEVKPTDAPKPTNLYGASKVFGEALCYTFSLTSNLSCLAIRIGAYIADEKIRNICHSRRDYEHVITQRDMGQLIHKCIIAPKKVKYGILSGISKNKKRDMDLKSAKKLVGYEPVDDAYEICKKLKGKRLGGVRK